jgi:hypothetical protein
MEPETTISMLPYGLAANTVKQTGGEKWKVRGWRFTRRDRGPANDARRLRVIAACSVS